MLLPERIEFRTQHTAHESSLRLGAATAPAGLASKKQGGPMKAIVALEIVQATKHLEDLEHELVSCDQPTFTPKQPPSSGDEVESLPPTP